MSRSLSGPRRGFTIAEMVVALLLFSIIGGGVLAVVVQQQRFYRSTADVIRLQGQIRQGATVLPLDLRGVSTSDTTSNSAATKYAADIYGKSDHAISFRRIFGSSVVCKRRMTGTPDSITVLPKVLLSRSAVSSWGIDPVVGDSILVLDEGKLVGSGDDVWRAHQIKSITPYTGIKGCPHKVAGDQTPLLEAADTVYASYTIQLAAPLSGAGVAPPTVLVGAPVRFFRRVKYELYQAADNQWYLGYSDCLRTYTTVSKCSEVTPLSGPYLPYTGIEASSGLIFAYYDSLGNRLAVSAESRLVSRVDIVMRSTSTTKVTRTGTGPGEFYRDSVVLSIGIRNRR